MIYVVDQNMMRSDDLRAQIIADTDCQFVIPDAAFEEMIKHENWEETMRRSFHVFEPVIERVFFAASIGELVRYETEHRRPVGLKQILPDELTERAREFVKAVLVGGKPLGEIRQRMTECRHMVLSERQSGDDLKSAMLTHITTLKGINGPDLMKDIRSGRMNAEARLGLLKLRAVELFCGFLKIRLLEANALQPLQWMIARLVCAKLWYQEGWLHQGGIGYAKPKMLANDEMDMEHVLIGSFFDKLISKDRRALRCDAALRRVISPAAESKLIEALEAHAVASGRLPS
jgi:hypothetical protein